MCSAADRVCRTAAGHVRVLLEGLARRELNGGSIFERISSLRYEVEIEVRENKKGEKKQKRQ